MSKSLPIDINNTTGWITAQESGTGNIVSAGAWVTGTSTVFTTELKPGDYIVDGGKKYPVAEIVSDTKIRLGNHANSNISSTAIKMITKRIKYIELRVDSAGDATVDGVTIKAGTTQIYTDPDGGRQEPLYIDATGTRVSGVVVYR